MAAEQGRTEVPDSEDEPLTSPSVYVSDFDVDKLSTTACVTVQERQGAPQANGTHQATAMYAANTVSDCAEGLDAERDNAFVDDIASRHVETDMHAALATAEAMKTHLPPLPQHVRPEPDATLDLSNEQHHDSSGWDAPVKSSQISRHEEQTREGSHDPQIECTEHQASSEPKSLGSSNAQAHTFAHKKLVAAHDAGVSPRSLKTHVQRDQSDVAARPPTENRETRGVSGKEQGGLGLPRSMSEDIVTRTVDPRINEKLPQSHKDDSMQIHTDQSDSHPVSGLAVCPKLKFRYIIALLTS